MPILQDPEQSYPRTSELYRPYLSNVITTRSSKESIGTQLCDGPWPDAPPLWDTSEKEVLRLEKEGSHCSRNGVCTSDRNELMERIKRGESPTWIPSQSLQEEYSKQNDNRQLPPSPSSGPHEPASLLPPANIEDNLNADNGEYVAELSPPSEIKRPRSALHAGDFNTTSTTAAASSQEAPVPGLSTNTGAQTIFETLPTTSWQAPYQTPQTPQSPNFSSPASPFSGQSASYRPGLTVLRSRAPSLNSHLSGFVTKTPTTPLVQQSNNTDLDFSLVNRSISPSKSHRRHTLPPRPAQSKDFSPSAHASTFISARQPSSLHRDPTFPIHAHRPRRSLTTTWSLQASPSPQAPTFLRNRRQSYSSESSPLQNASLVGSYEESILRGWMSTAPSKPVDFTAQIGVLGRANCKPKCPAHVSIPFPAVFYNWNGGMGRSRPNIDGEPSPYVGHIDLQNLPTPAESRKSRRSRSKSPPRDVENSKYTRDLVDQDSISEFGHTIKAQKKRRRTSPTPPSLQGGYRIPQKGQLQIIIKNPNKNAVKLFLVPYDLEDMQAGTKTFIRQRCYSTDPIVDGLLAKSNPEHTSPESGKSSMSKPTLRYLIHVNICSPSNGRYYLYQHIRVVFANRVPDNKEQLQTEIQVPQPRYSAYNPNFALSRSVSSSGMKMSRDKASMKRSAGFGVGATGMDDRHPHAFNSRETGYPPVFDSPPPLPVPTNPFHLSNTQPTAKINSRSRDRTFIPCKNQHEGNSVAPSRSTSGSYLAPIGAASPLRQTSQRTDGKCLENRQPIMNEDMNIDSNDKTDSNLSLRMSPSPLFDKLDQRALRFTRNNANSGSNGSFGKYSKLNKGDVGYGGRSSTPEPGEGLLARRLRGLEMQKGSEAAEKDGKQEWDGRNSAW